MSRDGQAGIGVYIELETMCTKTDGDRQKQSADGETQTDDAYS